MKKFLRIVKKKYFIESIIFTFLVLNELILKISEKNNIDLIYIIFIFFNSLIITFILSIIFNIIKNKHINIVLLYIFLFLAMLINCIELCVNNTFSTFYSVFYIFKMTNSVVGSFSDMILQTIISNIFYLILIFLPIICLIFFYKKIYKHMKVYYKYNNKIIISTLIVTISFLILSICGNTICKDIYKTNYNTNNSVIEFGLYKTIFLDIKYKIVGFPIGEENKYDYLDKNMFSNKNKILKNNEDIKEGNQVGSASVRPYEENIVHLNESSLVSSYDEDNFYETDNNNIKEDERAVQAFTPTNKKSATTTDNKIIITEEEKDYLNNDKRALQANDPTGENSTTNTDNIIVITEEKSIVTTNQNNKFEIKEEEKEYLKNEEGALHTYGTMEQNSIATINNNTSSIQDSFVVNSDNNISNMEEDNINSENYNMYDIDFDNMNIKKKNIVEMNDIIKKFTPTKKNKYTGFFKDKMLIQIVAEAFSPYVIDEELTPTLYKMSKSGFVCNNFYMPELAQSTTGGEFVSIFGLVPTIMNNMNSMLQSSLNYLPFTLAHKFNKIGYKSFAYHPTYDYYDRNLTHPALGFDFKAKNNGLPNVNSKSKTIFFDSIMAEITVDDYIKPYKEKGQKFYSYYMTYSGHGPYNDNNPRSLMHYNKIDKKYPDLSKPVKYYLASQLELEYMVSYIVDKLKENNMLDDVVFCISADHYPYVLAKENDNFYKELSKKEDTEFDASRFESTLILWSNDMKETIYIDEPVSSIDIPPTLLNLFGFKYDSRFFAGRDIFSDNYDDYYVSNNMPMVMIHRGDIKKISFVTKAGYYDAYKNVFHKNENVEVEEDYLTKMKNLCRLKFDLSRDIIFNDYFKYFKKYFDK